MLRLDSVDVNSGLRLIGIIIKDDGLWTRKTPIYFVVGPERRFAVPSVPKSTLSEVYAIRSLRYPKSTLSDESALKTLRLVYEVFSEPIQGSRSFFTKASRIKRYE
jgi:hypothetical protein